MYTNSQCTVRIAQKHTNFFAQSQKRLQPESDSLQHLHQWSSNGIRTVYNTRHQTTGHTSQMPSVRRWPGAPVTNQRRAPTAPPSITPVLTTLGFDSKPKYDKKLPGLQTHKYKFLLNTTALEHTNNYTYLGLNISATGNFNKAVNDLRDKARRAFYSIRRNIKLNIPIPIWLKILDSVIEPISLCGCEIWSPPANQEFMKLDKHQTETLHTELCKSILRVQRKTPNNACRAELGRYPLIIKIQKRGLKFYNHLKNCDPDTFHYKALTHRENTGRSPLSQLVLNLCSETEPSHTNQITPNQLIRKQKTIWHIGKRQPKTKTN